jgi:AraC-like DNA-binding protein
MMAATYTTLPGLRVTRRGGQELQLFHDHSSQHALNGFSRIFHEERDGSMDFQFYLGDHFQIWRSYYLMQENIHVCSDGDISMLELHIPLQGDAMNWWDGKKDNRLRKNQFELEYIPFITSDTLFHARQPCSTLDIHYDVSFLEPFAQQFPILDDFLLKVADRQRAHLLQNAVRFVSPAMMRIVQDILHFRGTSEFTHLYFQEQVSVLLQMVLERAMHVNADFSTKKYLDASVSIRELIERDPTAVHTGRSLSSHTGINVSLLHKIFREFNGTTLFDFSQGARLDRAKDLLRDTSLYILDIALACGYSEHANFTAAFRNRFGFTPQQYRDARTK